VSAPPVTPAELLLRTAPGLERQLAQKSRELLARGYTRIRVTLDPPSLGRLRVELDVSENRVAARIVATSTDALHLLQRDRDELVRSFQQAGMDEVVVDVESEARDTARGRDEEDRRGEGTEDAPAPAETGRTQTGRARDAHSRRIDLVA
jgi:flagellar hook-length control protein FliK